MIDHDRAIAVARAVVAGEHPCQENLQALAWAARDLEGDASHLAGECLLRGATVGLGSTQVTWREVGEVAERYLAALRRHREELLRRGRLACAAHALHVIEQP